MDSRAAPEEIKARLSIEELIGSYIPLKKAGRVYKALCPFHQEKTPSFTINPERGIYKCFGCGEGGDIFDFVMKMDGLNFPEAVTLLAERTGVQIDAWKPSGRDTGDQPKGPNKARLFELNQTVATLWHRVLTKHPKADTARDYLNKRGLNPEIIERFQLGYAPASSATDEQLRKSGFSGEEIRAAGEPARFRGRITFPITDLTGKVVGFTGRILEGANTPATGPKYWNTPETPIFIKSRIVYALHLAKHAIQERQIAILAEGQMDVIMLHQYGYENAVASSGTALTNDQLKLIRRFSPAVAFAYDSDRAGREATKRGVELALAAELTPYVIVIPEGKDPADTLLSNPNLWKEAYENRLPALEWIARELVGTGDTSRLPAEQKKKVARELVDWLARLTDPTEQADWFRTFAAHLRTNEENLRELYRRIHPAKPIAAAQEQPNSSTTRESPVIALTEAVFALLTSLPEAYPPVAEQVQHLPETARTAPSATLLLPLLEASPDISLEKILEQKLTDQDRTTLALRSEDALQTYTGIELTPTWAITELTILLRRIREFEREQAKSRIASQISQAQALGKTEDIQRLFQELQNLV